MSLIRESIIKISNAKSQSRKEREGFAKSSLHIDVIIFSRVRRAHHLGYGAHGAPYMNHDLCIPVRAAQLKKLVSA